MSSVLSKEKTRVYTLGCRHRHPNANEAVFTIAKTWKQPKCPSTDECMKKMWYKYTTEYCSAIKKRMK